MRWAAAVTALLVSSWTTAVSAGNDDEVLLGPDASMSAGAVTATERSGASLLYNPAGLANVEEDTVDLTLSALTWRRTEAPALLESDDGERDSTSVSEYLVVPAALAYVRPVGDRVRLAIGLFQTKASSGLLVSELVLDEPPPDDRVHAWQVAVDFSEQIYDGSVGVGWKLGKRFVMGAAAHVVFIGRESSSQFVGALGPPDSFSADAFLAQSAIEVDAIWGWRLGTGLQWQAHPQLRVGLSALSPTVRITMTRTSNLFIPALGVPGAGDQDGAFATDQSTERLEGFDTILPLRLRAGAAWTFADRSWLALDGDYQHSSDTESIDERSAVWNLRLGGQLAVTEQFGVGAGVFTDRGAAKRPASFGNQNVDFYGGTAGIHLGKVLALADGPSRAIHLDSALAVRYAYGSGTIGGLQVSRVVLSAGDAILEPAVGTQVHELSLYLGSTLRF